MRTNPRGRAILCSLFVSLTVSVMPAGCAHPLPKPVIKPTTANPANTTNTAPAGAAVPAAPKKDATMSGAPTTRAENHDEVLFGTTVSDPYRWLEDASQPDVKAWMSAQDEHARAALAGLSRRAALAARLKALYYVDSISAPSHKGNRYFYSRTHADKEKAILYVRDGEAGPERVLLDPNTWSTDGSVSLGVAVATEDGKTLAYGVKAHNSDEAVIHVMDVGTGKVSDVDVIEGGRYAHPSWTPAGDGFYYTHLPPAGEGGVAVADRPGQADVRFHALGTDPKKDPIVYEKTGDSRKFVSADLSRDGRYLFVYVQFGWNSVDVYYRDLRPASDKGAHKTKVAASAPRPFVPFIVGQPNIYGVEAWKDRFYVLTNEGAPKYRVFEAGADQPARAHWKEIIPEDKDSVIQSVQIVGGHLAVARLHNAASELEIRALSGALVRKVPLPGLGASHGVTGNPDDDVAYFAFDSFIHPLSIWKTSIKGGQTSLWAEVKLPIDASPYMVDQVFFPSPKDGERISMFLVHKKDLKKDGSTPFILGGYGGFNISMLPGFRSDLYPWLEAGGAYAVPNLRGGGEYGEDWHKAGMGAKKQNVFDDYIGAAEYLIKSGYTKPERLAIRGGSNGGLLVGAALTQRPDLYRAVICAVPLLDMVRYHKFGSGKTWISEYGSSDEEAGFRTLYAYSPYHHVKAGTRYPAVLMMSADSDDRVDPMHARKMAAALQSAREGAEVLLRIEKNAGHGGADLVKQAVEQSADGYAFLMQQLGL